MNKLLITLFVSVLFVFTGLSQSFAEIKVSSVKGRVSYKSGRVWKPLRAGMKLQEGSKISTGVRSVAVIRLDDHSVTVKPLTMIKIYENNVSKKSSTNRIGLRRGGVRASISRKRRVRTVFRISTPVATSSVRGTIEDVFYGPSSGMRVNVIKGIIEGSNRMGQKKRIAGNLVFSQKKGEPLAGDVGDEMKKKSNVYLFSQNLTKKERDSSRFLSGDLPGGDTDNPVDQLDNQSGAPASVSLGLEWH